MRECPRCETCYEDEIAACPADSSNTKHTLPGGRLLSNRYLLEKRLGRGAMGQVYLAQDQNLMTRRVAVKTVRPDILSDEDLQEGEAIARFEREARSAASIQHPNVVDVTDFGKSPDGVFFLVMEYVEGESLYQLLRREGTLSLQRMSAIMQQVVAGVDAAHEAGILHRDLKPANIFIMQKRKKSASGIGGGGEGFIKVGDFGLAKIVGQDRSDSTSASGPASRGIVGTPEYMAPEQMQPGFKLDARADVYALATIAYHMLGGRPPFTGDFTQLIAQKLTQAPPPLTTLRSDISPAVERIIMSGLARELSERPASAVEWLEQLDSAIGDPTVQRPAADSRVVILAPAGAEVYVDDERKGSVGRSGRVILTAIAPGRHVLRVARLGDHDDERVIEIRPDGAEQIIQAQLRSDPSSGVHLSPSRGGSLGSQAGTHSSIPGVVACTRCHSRFAAGAKFCGRCGNTSFAAVLEHPVVRVDPPAPTGTITCARCNTRYLAGTKFCGKCGIPIGVGAIEWKAPKPVEIFCPTCGTSYSAATKFCGRCGRPINP